ncbi:hypothetical protein Clacol_008528 [Clathrus columnatus]|uniref:Phospholipid/glycerol acyltransferase domain-containing protein n=1 Tax=Clathrus columnatus TaxID=1419009 RepID=A0AAV5AI34_9AGAM|nr:hypothetical protein Clacol_008528 [Clathrus columnatus]
MTVPVKPNLKEIYDREGYVIVPDLIEPSEFAALKDASSRVINETRSGNWPHRRTVGKQFPPYDINLPDSWGVQHVMHPDLQSPEFVRWYTGDRLCNVVKELMNCSDDDLQMELFNILINPESHDFALRWHRDDVKETATEEEEREALGKSHYGIQWNTALYDDSCLYIVPRSHKIIRSPEQRVHSSTMEAPQDPFDMPGAMQVHLKAGETVFYSNSILHCGTYNHHHTRATLHACVGDVRGGNVRATNVLQHGLDWIKTEKFTQTLPEGRAKNMWKKLIEMEKENGHKLEYSLEVSFKNRSFLSRLIVRTVGLSSKAFLRFLCADVKVVGLTRLLEEVEKIRIGKSKGLITVSNHISVMDEPLMWGVLPTSHILRARPYAFKRFFSEFFRQGQVLETVRGGGINQPAIDRSIELLNAGEWIHVFPEGKTTQPPHSNLSRLKWGIGRMLMETNNVPTILPIWLTGFDQVMDETRGFPRFLPRPGKKLSITVGDSEEIQARISEMLLLRKDFSDTDTIRSDLTAVIRDGLSGLGSKVSKEVGEQQLKKGKDEP